MERHTSSWVAPCTSLIVNITFARKGVFKVLKFKYDQEFPTLMVSQYILPLEPNQIT